MAKEAPDSKPAVKTAKTRNLTYEGLLAHAQMQREAALSQVSAHEVVEISVAEQDATGKPILKNGFPVLTKQAVLKRDLVSLEWDKKIEFLTKQAEAA
jgi:hypothetical protein